MWSLRFAISFALVCAASGARAAPQILEIPGQSPEQAQEQAQERAQERAQEQAQEQVQLPVQAPVQKPVQERVQQPDNAPASAPAQAQAPAQAKEKEGVAAPPQGRAEKPAAAPEPAQKPEPPKQQAAEPVTAPGPQPPAGAPSAGTQAPKDEAAKAASRFRFRRVDDGVLRLDSESGQVAFCSSHAAGWACQAVPEERAALEKEIARLQGEVAGLEDKVASLQKEIATLREPSPPRPPADLAPRDDGHGGLRMPNDQDMARARAAIVDAWGRLMDMLGQLQRDLTRRAPPPDRTTL